MHPKRQWNVEHKPFEEETSNLKFIMRTFKRHFHLRSETFEYLPKIVWKITDQKSIVLRPKRSDKYPLMIPPVATPTRKNISATFFKYSLSHTKFHSEVQVLPRLSFISNSHSLHLMCSVVLWTSASFRKPNAQSMFQRMFVEQIKQRNLKCTTKEKSKWKWKVNAKQNNRFIRENYSIDITNICEFDTWFQLRLLMWQLSWDWLMFRHSLWSMWLNSAGRLHQNLLSAAFNQRLRDNFVINF